MSILTPLIAYIIQLLSPQNLSSIVITVVLVSYMKIQEDQRVSHLLVHKIDAENDQEWRREAKMQFKTIKSTLDEVRHILDRYLFKFESEDQKSVRERIDKILSKVKAKTGEIELKLKVMLKNQSGQDYAKKLHDAYTLIVENRAEVVEDLLEEGFDMTVIRVTTRISEMLYPLIKEKLEHIVEIATDDSLNGSKPYALDSMISDLENYAYSNWERLLVNELKM